ncbi:MAG: YebC/PmpR family DNA-binding transcriptional regulator [Verrucomicrobiota bacterium]
MAGHNKWSKVKHIKARVDAKRGKVFSRLARDIAVAARDGGGDPDLNPRLRQAIDSAKSQSVPKDNIERAIKKGTGELGGEAIQELTYEGYAPGGAAIIAEVASDNTNRAAADIRSIFNKNNGNLGSSNSVAYLFDRKGEIRIPAESATEDEILEHALDAGAEDVFSDEDDHVVLTPHDQLAAVADGLREKNLQISSQQLVYIPQTTVRVDDKSDAAGIIRLINALEDYEDTVNVSSNFETSEEILETVAG